MAAQQRASEGMKSPIYNLLHVCNYPDHQRGEKNINPQTFVGPCLKWSHAFPRPGALGLRAFVCEFGVTAHPPVSDGILHSACLPSAKARSFEPCGSSPFKFRLSEAAAGGRGLVREHPCLSGTPRSCLLPEEQEMLQPPSAVLMPVDFLAASLCWKVVQTGDKPWSLESERIKRMLEPVSCSSPDNSWSRPDFQE